MSRLTEKHKQQLRVREMQMEMETDGVLGSNPLSDDVEGKLEAAQKQLHDLQQAQEKLEREKEELQVINERKEEFLHGQVEISEKLSATITVIERELFEMKRETEEMETTRQSFAMHLDKIEKLNPESWTRENLKQELNRAISMIDLAEEEYDQAMDDLAQLNRAGGAAAPVKKKSPTRKAQGDFSGQFMQGLAFNMPVIILGVIALLIWIAK